MSAAGAIEAALIAALRAHAPLGERLNAIEAGKAVRASPPYAELGETLVADWGVKDRRGRELRLLLAIHDQGESPRRLHALMGEAEQAIEAMPRAATGWEIASIAFLRSRITRDAPGRWSGTIEYRMRVLEAG